jgi:hypothetical protein
VTKCKQGEKDEGSRMAISGKKEEREMERKGDGVWWGYEG